MCLPWMVPTPDRARVLVTAGSLEAMSDDSRDFHKPVRRPAEVFDRLFAAEDPAEVSRVAHSTAHALLARVRQDPTGEVLDRLVSFTDEHGIDDLAELWSRSPARTLPGALWRLYLLQLMIHDDPRTAALLYERGRIALDPAAAFCRVQASGATHVADDYEATEPERASTLTTRALRLTDYAGDLAACAALWRMDALS